MDERLRRVVETGNTDEFYRCIQEDPTVFDRIDEAEFFDTPLHIAAARGHVDFAMAIMNLKPSFARKLNQDVNSPIHLALQNHHTEIVFRLLEIDKELVRVKGKESYTPFHYVVENENLELITQFLKDCPECIEDVTVRNETALHIAAKNDRVDALEVLLRWLQRSHIYGKVSKTHLLNLKDGDDNTVLHIAAYHTQPQMIKLLIECKVDMMEINLRDLTALDILETQRQSLNRDICLNLLRSKGALNASSIPIIEDSYKSFRSKITFFERITMGLVGPIMNMSAERINALLVGLTLVITAIYQAILSPPGGVVQGDITMNATEAAEAGVGNSVMDAPTFQVFFALNYVVFLFTAFTLVTLIQFVTNSGGIAIIVELLVSLLTCSFLGAMKVIVPPKADFLKDTLHFPMSIPLERKLQPLYFLVMLFFMELVRRFCLVFKRWYDEV